MLIVAYSMSMGNNAQIGSSAGNCPCVAILETLNLKSYMLEIILALPSLGPEHRSTALRYE